MAVARSLNVCQKRQLTERGLETSRAGVSPVVLAKATVQLGEAIVARSSSEEEDLTDHGISTSPPRPDRQPVLVIRHEASMKKSRKAEIGDPFSHDGEPINDSRTGDSGEGTSGANRTSAGPTIVPKEFLCDLCAGRSFTSQRGLSVHMRRIHPVEYEGKLTQSKEQNPSVKHVWREEERMLIAEAELRLRAGENPPRFINKALAEMFPQWSDNVISCQRKGAPYQDAMRKLKQQVEKESKGLDPGN